MYGRKRDVLKFMVSDLIVNVGNFFLTNFILRVKWQRGFEFHTHSDVEETFGPFGRLPRYLNLAPYE